MIPSTTSPTVTPRMSRRRQTLDVRCIVPTSLPRTRAYHPARTPIAPTARGGVPGVGDRTDGPENRDRLRIRGRDDELTLIRRWDARGDNSRPTCAGPRPPPGPAPGPGPG